MKKVGIAALIIIIGFGAWLLGSAVLNKINGGDGQKQGSALIDEATKTSKETIFTEADLKLLAQKYPPLYWAGPRDGTKYGVSITPNRIFVRYIPNSDIAGSTNQYLTVITNYAMPSAYDVLSKANDAEVTKATNGTNAVVVRYNGKPNDVYFTFPGSSFQVQVYSPESDQAWNLVKSSTVRRVN